MHLKRLLGATLIEVVISIVVIAVGVTGVFSVFIQTAKRASEPVILVQAQNIAQAYLDEILQQAFNPQADTGRREDFNDVGDYAGLSDQAGPFDRFGNAISALAGYNVNVAVTDAVLNGVNSRRIAVTVTHDSWAIPAGFSQSVVLVAHKTGG